ncbi:MAG: PAN domain-containing protein [Pyrinomonadaceae bacterium]
MTDILKKYTLLLAGCAASLALFAFTFNAPTVESQATFSVEYDTDRRFGDYKSFEIQQSNHEVCRNACAADGNCKAYTYTKPWQQWPAKCWLKNTVPPAESGLTCCISGVKGGTPPTANFAGTYDAYAWAVITIQQNGDRVTGSWTGGPGNFSGVVRGNTLYFTWRDNRGNEGEAVLAPIDSNNPARHGLTYCYGRGCDPAKRDGYVEAVRR